MWKIVTFFSISFAYSLAQWGAKCENFEVKIFGCIGVRSVGFSSNTIFWLHKFLQRKSYSSSLLVRSAIDDFFQVWMIFFCIWRDNLFYFHHPTRDLQGSLKLIKQGVAIFTSGFDTLLNSSKRFAQIWPIVWLGSGEESCI